MDIPPWSTLLPNDQLAKLASGLSLAMIMTPASDLVTIGSDATVGDCVREMRDYFDQLPVVSEGKLMGMMFRSNMSDVDQNSIVLDVMTPLVNVASIHSTDDIGQAIELLSKHEVCIVFDPESGRLGGLMHFADLNKHPVRIYCYLWISALEMSLAELLQNRLPNLPDWIDCLSDHRQVQVLGRFEYAKRQNIEILPTEGLELSDLVSIFAKKDSLRHLFSMSKTQFEKRANRLVDLRNRSMHPVRTLVNAHDDVESLTRQFSSLKELATKSAELLHTD